MKFEVAGRLEGCEAVLKEQPFGSTEAPHARQRFEDMVAQLSARFATLPLNDVDGEIERALKQVLDFFQGDRCGLLAVKPDRTSANVTHACYAEDVQQVSGEINLAGLFPWRYGKLVQRMPVSTASMKELPGEADKDRQSYAAMGVQSSLDIPVIFGDRVSHIIVIQTIRQARTWPQEYIPRLRLLGEIFANALARKRADRALRESEERLSMAADSANVGLWVMQIETGQFWVTAKTRELFGVLPDQDMTVDLVLAKIHDEDRDRVRRIIKQTIESGKENSVEYRILKQDGGTRWILSRGRPYPASSDQPARMMGVSLDITERKQSETELQAAYTEIRQLKDRLLQENKYLRSEIAQAQGTDEIIGTSAALKYVLFRVEQVSPMDTTVLLLGETGSGKGVIARHIHSRSRRRDRPFITVNCAALPANLIESELFGREKGAFTGSHERQMGRFELADGGTIFLDEIGEMALELQSKLLRVIQDGEFERLGSPRTIKVNVRIIASTNRNLEEAVRQKVFREDLYYRLNVFPITIPPLRQRKDDIEPLVEHFIAKHRPRTGCTARSFPEHVLEELRGHSWPGNVRELESVVERAMITSQGSDLKLTESNGADSGTALLEPELQTMHNGSLAEMEREYILKMLKLTRWRIEGEKGVAQVLGVKPSTLRARMKKLGIKKPVLG